MLIYHLSYYPIYLIFFTYYNYWLTSRYTSNLLCVVTGIPARASLITAGSVATLFSVLYIAFVTETKLTYMSIHNVLFVFRFRNDLAPVWAVFFSTQARTILFWLFSYLHWIDCHGMTPLFERVSASISYSSILRLNPIPHGSLARDPAQDCTLTRISDCLPRCWKSSSHIWTLWSSYLVGSPSPLK